MHLASVKLCLETELMDNSMRRFMVGEKEILVDKFAGKYYALDDRCTHRGGPLSEGSLEEGTVTCPWHYGQFDLETGNARSPPPTEPLRRYELTIEEGNVLISIT